MLLEKFFLDLGGVIHLRKILQYLQICAILPMIITRPLRNLSAINRALLPKNTKILMNSWSYRFCDLPKSSRFSQQLGLDKQLKQSFKNAQSIEKQSVITSHFIIWAALSIFGSLLVLFFMKDRNRYKIQILYKIVRSSESKQILELVQGYQQKFTLKKLKYQDYFINKVLGHMVGSLKYRQERELLQTVLANNLKNMQQLKQTNLYEQYLQHLLLDKKYQPQQITQKSPIQMIINNILCHGSVKAIFLSKQYVSRTGAFNLREPMKTNVKNRIKDLKQQLQKKCEKIEQLKNKNILVEPYEFEIRVQRIWLEEIQKYFIKKI